jgi:hypothetical protein
MSGARVLTELVAHKGKPQVLQIDNGPEFRGKVLDLWISGLIKGSLGLSKSGKTALY